MKISISQLPGIGQKISMRTKDDQMMVLIVHHTGKRELYFFDDMDSDEADYAFELSPDETREVAAQLLGATYQPADIEKMRFFRKQLIVDYIKVRSVSPIVNKTIEEADIRGITGAIIIGIVDGEELSAVPEADTVLYPGMILMAIGKDEQIGQLSRLCQGED